MHTIWAIGVLAALVHVTSPASAQEEHRHLGAHVHGHGRLNIAIEGRRVSMELEVPGADIVGFEHEPSTPEQKTAIAQAKAKLANALVLFAPAPQAGCKLEHVNISAEGAHEHEDQHELHEAAPGNDEGTEHRHSEFHANYVLDCASPSRLTSMTFDYFKAFPGAQELDIAVISPKGQSSYEVTRDKPSLDLAGLM